MWTRWKITHRAAEKKATTKRKPLEENINSGLHIAQCNILQQCPLDHPLRETHRRWDLEQLTATSITWQQRKQTGRRFWRRWWTTSLPSPWEMHKCLTQPKNFQEKIGSFSNSSAVCRRICHRNIHAVLRDANRQWGETKNFVPNCNKEVWHKKDNCFELAKNTAHRPLVWTTRLWQCGLAISVVEITIKKNLSENKPVVLPPYISCSPHPKQYNTHDTDVVNSSASNI